MGEIEKEYSTEDDIQNLTNWDNYRILKFLKYSLLIVFLAFIVVITIMALIQICINKEIQNIVFKTIGQNTALIITNFLIILGFNVRELKYKV